VLGHQCAHAPREVPHRDDGDVLGQPDHGSDDCLALSGRQFAK
jgi:hypothetical protein